MDLQKSHLRSANRKVNHCYGRLVKLKLTVCIPNVPTPPGFRRDFPEKVALRETKLKFLSSACFLLILLAEMSSQTEAEDRDLMAKAAKATEDLYYSRNTYFPADLEEKMSRLQSEADLALKLLDSIPLERKSPSQRATYEFLRGKILDVFPDYKKEAEDHLSKAVKLNPSLSDAWLCLGNCIWKKGDLPAAKNCFSLALTKGPNKKILCQLSMLERKMAQGTENQAQIVEESIQHAKEAIALDVKDGNSWYNLGNACLTSFFVTGAWDHNKLLHSLKAYQNAEKDESVKSNPDLYFNCATVNKYLENYERALTGFEAAALKDPGLNATEEVQKMINLLDKVESSLKGQTKAKRLASLASSLADVKLNSSYKRATTSLLLEGLNKGVAVVGRVLLFINHENLAPLYYLVCDSDQTCFVLSVYGLRNDVIKEGDRLTLLEPCYRGIDFTWKGKHYNFKSIRVDFLEQLLVNGKAPSPQQAVCTSIYAQHKP
ncbi:PREDICTED: tetratricopeptide repeat protein 5-like isoform X2 [Nelumbo nucifera]|uniref:Tetratricopeptide repeat protein 5-like isoform X2 n=1 Tax=Nelumbo nucifera TaxID=4432 RepID=A0A1U7ZVS5_NELNU|nr:PREDICTED: tetratricopeptide repeat protein 5-like isoform X2 [Nelumbo nucifera]